MSDETNTEPSYVDAPVPRVFDIDGVKPTLPIHPKALEAIRALKTEGLDVRALQDYYAAVAASQ